MLTEGVGSIPLKTALLQALPEPTIAQAFSKDKVIHLGELWEVIHKDKDGPMGLVVSEIPPSLGCHDCDTFQETEAIPQVRWLETDQKDVAWQCTCRQNVPYTKKGRLLSNRRQKSHREMICFHLNLYRILVLSFKTWKTLVPDEG